MKRLSIQKKLDASDTLTRFLFYKGDINFDKKCIKTSVFSKAHPNGFSVFLTTGLDHHSIWKIGKKYVAPNYEKQSQPRSLIGRFDLKSEYYQQANLKITYSYPPPKHYNIYGMPIPSTAMAKELSLRQTMANKSTLWLIDDKENPSWAKYGIISKS